MRFTRFSSASQTRPASRFFNFAFLLLLRMRCEVFAWKRLTFPEPVSRKRFFALECVFIFGIDVFFRNANIGIYLRKIQIKGNKNEMTCPACLGSVMRR